MFKGYKPTVKIWPFGSMLRIFDSMRLTVISWLLLSLVFTSLVTLAVPRYASRIVETKTGQVRGILRELNERLDPVEVFRGIPYAAPPIGNLRLRSPFFPTPWSGVKLADTFGFVCPQKLPNISDYEMALTTMPIERYYLMQEFITYLRNQSEDCLTLNLYIPGSGSRGLEAPYAVLVYIHGESFEWGTGNMYDGSVLASAGHIIVVTLNYRLGILGFLRTRKTPDEHGNLGGNLALQDIIMGLQWVKENIAAFGGDATRITLMGHDTGAALANLVLLSPTSKGLLHRVILLSGSALSPWSSVHSSNNLLQVVSEQLGCPKDDGDLDIADCLRNVPLHELLSLQLPELKFVPRIGPILPIDQNSLDPALDMERASDAFIKVPLILGVTTAEAFFDFNNNDIKFGFEENQRNRILRTFIRNTYYYHLNEILSAVKNEYTDWDKPVLHPVNLMESTMEALSDGHTVAPLMRLAFYHARRGAKTFFLHFNYQTKDSQYPQRLGCARGQDIPYIFGLPLILGGSFFPHNYSRQDQGVAEAVLTFLTNFAKTADPNLPHNIESVDYGTEKEKARFRGLSWEPYETGSQLYLTIALKPKIKNHYRGHKMAMWLNLIPQLHQPGDNDVSMRHHHFRERGDHFYIGAVRDELHTPIPQPDFINSTLSTACTSSQVNNQIIADIVTILSNNADDSELLRQIESRHYYSTTTALAITVGVGCILLLLNILIFAGIYYQRDRDKKRTFHYVSNGRDSVPMTVRPTVNTVDHSTSVQELPPSYATVSKNITLNYNKRNNEDSKLTLKPIEETELFNDTQTSENDSLTSSGKKKLKPPLPPIRNSSFLNSGEVVKKRVKIQEMPT